jgi:hypothetical protein
MRITDSAEGRQYARKFPKRSIGSIERPDPSTVVEDPSDEGNAIIREQFAFLAAVTSLSGVLAAATR